MLASEIIKKLNELIEHHGDLEVMPIGNGWEEPSDSDGSLWLSIDNIIFKDEDIDYCNKKSTVPKHFRIG